MPLQKLQFRPGVNRESTTYANEGGWFASEKIRFRSGQPEKIGGWTNLASQSNGTFYTYVGVNRDMCNWVTLSYANLNAIGTNQKYYFEYGGKYYDITPLTSASPVSLTNPFTTVSGSKLVTVTASGHGASPGTWVTFSGGSAVGGVTTTATGSSGASTITVASATNITIGQNVSGTGIGIGAVVTVIAGTTITLSVVNSGAVSGNITFGASTTATGSSGASTITVASATNIAVGQGVTGTNIGSGAVVTAINGTTITLSAANTGAVSGSVFFTISISGEYEIISTPDGNSFTIINSVPAAVLSTGGGSITANYQINAGNATYSVSNGFGTGPWNGVTFGAATTTLSSNITSTATSISVASTSGFPSPTGTIVIEAEIITYTGTTATSFTGCTRSTVNNTVHSSGVLVQQYSTQVTGDLAFAWDRFCAAKTANGIGTQLRTWSSDNFGEDLVFVPRGGAIYYWVPDTSTTPARAITLQKAAQNAGRTDYTYVPNTALAVISSDVQRFVIALGANPYTPGTPGSTFDPMLVRWSDQQNAYSWVPSATNQAGEYRLQGGSTIVTGIASKQENLIWTDAALFSMQYLGPPYVWGFNQLASNVSIISPNAVASVNNQTFWMGVDKFYVYSGRVDTLPCTLRQYVFNDINQDQAYQIVAGTNEGFNEVWWMYPSYGSPVNDRYVVYNHLEQIWYYGNINRTAWLDSALRQFPMGAFSVQNTYLDQTITSDQTSITVINGYSYPESGTLIIDSEYIDYTGHDRAQGNTIKNCVRGAVNPVTKLATTKDTHTIYTPVTYCTPNQVMYHENGTDDGSLTVLQPIEAYVESSDFDIEDGHNFGFVTRMLPDVTFDGSTVEAPQLTISVKPRQNSGTAYGLGDSPAVVSGNNYSNPLVHNYLVQLFTGQVYTRIRGRQISFRVRSTDLGVAWQLGATRIDIRPDGRR